MHGPGLIRCHAAGDMQQPGLQRTVAHQSINQCAVHFLDVLALLTLRTLVVKEREDVPRFIANEEEDQDGKGKHLCDSHPPTREAKSTRRETDTPSYCCCSVLLVAGEFLAPRPMGDAQQLG